MRRSRILVTGGAGYIGSHACRALAARGYEPVTYDNLSRGNRWAVKWGPLEEGEIADGAHQRAVLDRHQPVAVMHFAAFAYVGESVEQPLRYYQNNVGGSAALFRAIVETATIPVVFSSTCATYGVPEKISIPEEHPQRPINPYGFSKLVVERMLADLGRAHGLRSIALRYFNAAGADPDADIGEAHDPEPHFADAHVRALDYLLSGCSSCALNLANAQGYSVMDVIQVAQRVSGKAIRVEMAPRRPGDPPVLVGAADRARAMLGWAPRCSALDVQIVDAWKWMQKELARCRLVGNASQVSGECRFPNELCNESLCFGKGDYDI